MSSSLPWVKPPSSGTCRSVSAIYVSVGRCTYTQNEFEGSLSPHGDVDAQTAHNFLNPNIIDVIPTLVKPVFDKDPPSTLPNWPYVMTSCPIGPFLMQCDDVSMTCR